MISGSLFIIKINKLYTSLVPLFNSALMSFNKKPQIPSLSVPF